MVLFTWESIKESYEKNRAVLNCTEVIWGARFTLLLECREKEIPGRENYGINNIIILRKIKNTAFTSINRNILKDAKLRQWQQKIDEMTFNEVSSNMLQK